MRRFFSLLLMCLVVTTLMAIPARRGTFTAKQSDGTTLTLKMVGDEHLHYFVNVSSNEKMYRDADGDFHVLDETTLNGLVSKANARRAEANAQRVKRLQRRTGASANGARRIGSISGAMTGTKKGLVILVNFSDKTMAAAHTQTIFNNQFNEEGYTEGGHLGSVHDYFYDQSYGVFDLEFDVVGPVTVSNTMSYYGGNDSSGNDEHPAEMVIEACKLADAAGTNFADYDWDNDGTVDQVYVIYAGFGEAYGASSSTIWPHEWQLTSAKSSGDGTGALTLDGVKIDTYACSCELSGTSGTTLNGIGTACHEFSHCLGFPDFYDTSYAGGFGMNSWDLMDAGSYNGPDGCGEVPAGYTSYERMCAGWLTPTELASATTITGMKSLNESPEAYVIYNDKNTDEYILLENRQNEKWFKYVDTYTSPHGLLAIHVDYDEDAWNDDEPNNTATHQRMSIIPASGTYGTKTTSSGQTYYTCTESQLKGHPFSGSSSKTSLTGTSNSSSGGVWFTACSTGSTALNHEVTEISNASDGTISFLFDGGAVVDDGSRYTVTFNAGTGTCSSTSWTQTDFLETTTLPSCTAPSGWTFLGWSTSEVEEGSSCPSLYFANSSYQPTADVTFYAVYKSSASGSGTGTGDYVLVTTAPNDWSGEYLIVYTNDNTNGFIMDGSLATMDAINNYQKKTITNNTLSGSECDNYKFTIAASSTKGTYSLKSASDLYIGFTGNSNGLSTSSTDDYTNTIALASDGTATIKSSGGKYLTFNNSTSQMRFRYYATAQKLVYLFKKDGSGSGTYATNPGGDGLIVPTITFASPTQNILMGETNDTFTATVTNSTGAVTYTSSDATVATVGPKTGRVVAKGVGTTTITATVAAVDSVSKAASATYKLTVSMPVLTGIAVTTQPTKTTYLEQESFSKDGMVITATYANGYKQVVDDYTCEPSTNVILTTEDKEIVITYTEDTVTVTTTVAITVNPLPTYTVTFNAGSGTCTSTSLTESAYQKGVTLPSATGVNEEWVFAGWCTENVAETTTRPTLLIAGSTYSPTSDITLYAVYSLSETSGGSGNYELVTSAPDDWSGDYIIAYSSTIMVDGRKGGTAGIGATTAVVAPGDNLSGTTIAAEWGDTYHVTLEAITGGYAMKTQDGCYNYRGSNANGIDTTSVVANVTPITVTFNASSDVDLLCAVSTTTSSCPVFHYNSSAKIFRFYKSGGQSNVYLYKKQGSLISTTYATTPSGTVLAEPTIAFAETAEKAMLVGDSYTNVATAVNSTGAITYTSSDTNIATVDKNTGEVTARGVGTVTITAFVDAVSGVSKSASTTYTINVSMPALSNITIATPANNLTFDEGASFTAAGLSLTATYVNGYIQTITSGYTTSPAEGEAVALSNETVTVTYGGKTTTYTITVNELPKYAVTFMINGESQVISQTVANTGVLPPAIAGFGDYTFAGWSLTDITEETTTKPTLVTLTDDKYTPTASTTLYAIYTRSDGNFAQGFTLNLTYNDKTYYVGAANSTNKRFDSSTTSGLTLYFSDGYLWYENTSGTATYVYNKTTADYAFTTTKSGAESYLWTMTEENGVATFYSSTTSRYMALNTSSTSIVRGYNESFPHEWTITYTGDTFDLGSTYYYTGHPAMDITKDHRWTIADLTALIDILNGDSDNARYDYEAADVDGDGDTDTADVIALTEILLRK